METAMKCPLCGLDADFYTSKNKYDLYKCGTCDFIFVYPPLTPEEANSVYSEEYFKKDKGGGFGYIDYDKDKEAMRDVFISYLEEIERNTSRKEIFDIGTATGYFLDLARGRGWKTYGIEVSAYAGKIAQEKGHKIAIGDLMSLEADKYPVVTLFDVLEHLSGPKDYILKVMAILEEGGIIAVNTLDQSSWWARCLGKKWHAFVPPEHLNYFNKKNLMRFLEQHGFRILTVKKIGKKFTLGYIFKTLYEWQGWRIWKKISEFFARPFWQKIYIPINLGDNIFIVARKQ